MRTRWVSRNTSGRDIVVGDVHGCFRTLDRALGAIAFNSSQDRHFGVGDLVNRGPHSADALDWLEQRFESVVLGNHDRSVLSWFRAKRGSPSPANAKWLLGVSRREHRRWRRALEGMPLAITVETRHGAVGLVHAEAPHPSWAESLRALDGASEPIVNDALLGLDAPREAIARHRMRGVEGVRVLVHGHEPVEQVERVANRWNIDTGAGIASLNRLSLVEVNAAELRTWTFAVDESS